MSVAVAVIAFNRPDLTGAVLDRVLAADVGPVLIVADGPRRDRPQDPARVEAVRRLAKQDPRLELHASDENLGLRRNYERAVDRLMAEHGRGIVLEDDTLPDLSFFPYVAELLHRYADDERIGAVCGQQMRGRPGSTASYGFSHIAPPWGWATWARAWKDYDRNLSSWPALRASGQLDRLLGPATAREWSALFDHAASIDSCWIRWVLTSWTHHRLAAVPAVNLVTNLGVGDDATHTSRSSRYARHGLAPTQPISFPLRHPPHLGERCAAAEQQLAEAALPFSPLKREFKRWALDGPWLAFHRWKK